MNDDARTTLGTPGPHPGNPSPLQLREQIERTRDELGRTVGALPADTGTAAHTDSRTDADADADGTARAAENSAPVSDRIRLRARRAGQLVTDRTPEPVREKAARAAARARRSATRAGRYTAARTPDPLLDRAGRAATAARAHRTPLLAVGAAVTVFLLGRRSRGRRR
ncbi:DUF3618 domain-containing protein [Streptomyces subrutilus]|uniref:DUF3618 domain-containing protein n=1 Tax=Streptomyces subrutilus TaxID=36818 RepID=UPI002E15B212|nr:DUF3618 domain-containing protein [Streptomyces subrutilus]